MQIQYLITYIINYILCCGTRNALLLFYYPLFQDTAILRLQILVCTGMATQYLLITLI